MRYNYAGVSRYTTAAEGIKLLYSVDVEAGGFPAANLCASLSGVDTCGTDDLIADVESEPQ